MCGSALGDGACDEGNGWGCLISFTVWEEQGWRYGGEMVFIRVFLIQTAMVRLESDFKLYVGDLTTFLPKSKKASILFF